MAFPQQASQTPTSIGQIEIHLTDNDGQQVNASASFNVVVRDAAGGYLRTVSGDLMPHLTTAQKTTIWTFLTALRTKAVAEVLP